MIRCAYDSSRTLLMTERGGAAAIIYHFHPKREAANRSIPSFVRERCSSAAERLRISDFRARADSSAMTINPMRYLVLRSLEAQSLDSTDGRSKRDLGEILWIARGQAFGLKALDASRHSPL